MPAMSKMKRPAAVEDGALAGLKKGKFVQSSSSSSSYMKRPAAAGGVKAAIDKMQAGCKVDDGDEAGDGSEADSTTRDKGKGEKFAAMMKANMLPNHVQHLYNEVAKTKSSPRDFRTQIINSLFDRKPNGRFELRDDKPLFEEAKEIYDRKYSKDRAVAYPRAVMKGLYFQNSESAFMEALESGDIQEVEDPSNPDNPVKFYAYRKLETGKESGSVHSSKLKKQRRANPQQAELMSEMMTSLGWTFNYKSHLKIEKGKLPAAMTDLLDEAIEAQTKIQGEAEKLMPRLLGVTTVHHFLGRLFVLHIFFTPTFTPSTFLIRNNHVKYGLPKPYVFSCCVSVADLGVNPY